MYYTFLLISHVFLHSLLCLWSKRLPVFEKLHLTSLFFVYTTLLPLSYIIPIRSIRVGKYVIGGIPYKHLLNQFTEIFISQSYATGAIDAKMIIDAGANIGMATVYFAYYYPDATITSIEPDPEIFIILKNNIEANHLTGRVNLINSALGKAEGLVALYHNGQPGRTTMSLLQERDKLPNKTSVSMCPLSKYVSSGVSILKMDIEGAEHEVFEEMERSDKLKHVQFIVMEYHHILNNSTATRSLAGFLGRLEAAGFSYSLDTFHSPLFPHVTQDLLIGASRI